jgi:hypothetical protein
MADSSKGFVSDHWEGNTPLGTAFWQNTVLIPGVVACGVYMSAASMGRGDNPFFGITLMLLFALFAVSVWSLRGAFKSASLHVARGGRALWRNLAVAGLLIYILALALAPVAIMFVVIGIGLSGMK